MPSADGTPPKLKAVALPPEPRFLRIGGCGLPVLDEETAPPGSRIAVQAVDLTPRPTVLMLRLTRDATELRVNGLPASRVALLHSGDQILFDGQLLHIATFLRPPIATAGDSHAGKECPVCRGGIKADDEVYVCPCGWGPLHSKSAARPGLEQALECAALLRECRSCGRPLILDERWEHVPVAV